MKKRILIALVVVLALAATASLVWAAMPDGTTGPYADFVHSWAQGTRKDGSPVLAARSDPWDAVGPPDSPQPTVNFFSLGFSGWIVLGFDNYICNDAPLDIKAFEVTWGTYPLEKAEVRVSQDGSSWTFAGTVDNAGNSTVDLPASLPWAQYVKLLDVSNPAVHSGTADGYDLDAVEALHWSETPCGLIIVGIDIKPGSYPNCFNNNGHGVIPVAILGSADFDVSQVDASSVELAGLRVRVVGKSNKLLAHIEDVNGDGFDDLVVQIEDTDGAFVNGNGTAKVSGNLYDGTPFEGSDDICIVPPE